MGADPAAPGAGAMLIILPDMLVGLRRQEQAAQQHILYADALLRRVRPVLQVDPESTL